MKATITLSAQVEIPTERESDTEYGLADWLSDIIEGDHDINGIDLKNVTVEDVTK